MNFKTLNSQIFLVIIFLSFTYASSASATITKITQMDDILPSINEETLVLFDLDDTLICSATTLQSGKWLSYFWHHFENEMPDQISLIEHFMWHTTDFIPIKPVESGTPQIVSHVQQLNDVVVLGFTARHILTDNYNDKLKPLKLTFHHLSTIGIDFSQIVVPESLTTHASFREGIIFTSGKPKGDHLIEFLVHANYYPKKIVFVDDRWEQIVSVENAMITMGIACDCFWYTRVEKDSKTFDPIIAIIQLENILNNQILLSDEEASVIKEGLERNKYAEETLVQILKRYENIYKETR